MDRKAIGTAGLFRVVGWDPSEKDGALSEYGVYGPHPWSGDRPTGDKLVCEVSMLSRPAREGADGATEEALLLIVQDRLQAFAKLPSAGLETKAALAHVEEALAELAHRHEDRTKRRVEGTREA